MRSFDLLHADQLRKSFVHRVHRQGRRLELVTLLEGRNVRLVRDAAQQETVRGLFLREQRQRRLVDVRHQLRHFLLAGALGIHGPRRVDRQAFAIRIGIGQRSFETGAAEDDHKPVLLARYDVHLGRAQLLDLAGQDSAETLAGLRRNAAGPAVRDDPLRVERAEVRPDGDVAALQMEPQTQGFDHPAADLELQRVVAEQGEVARTAARRNARRDRNHPALRDPAGDEGVEVGRPGGFQGREFALFLRGDVAQTVEHEQDEFRSGLDGEFRVQVVQFHGSFQCPSSNEVQVSVAGSGRPVHLRPKAAY